MWHPSGVRVSPSDEGYSTTWWMTAFWDGCSGANSRCVASTWGNQIIPQTGRFWKPLNSPSFTLACRDRSAQQGSLHELFVVGTSQSAGVSEAVTTHTVGRPEPHLAEDWAVECCCSVLLLNWKTHLLCGVLKKYLCVSPSNSWLSTFGFRYKESLRELMRM